MDIFDRMSAPPPVVPQPKREVGPLASIWSIMSSRESTPAAPYKRIRARGIAPLPTITTPTATLTTSEDTEDTEMASDDDNNGPDGPGPNPFYTDGNFVPRQPRSPPFDPNMCPTMPSPWFEAFCLNNPKEARVVSVDIFNSHIEHLHWTYQSLLLHYDHCVKIRMRIYRQISTLESAVFARNIAQSLQETEKRHAFFENKPWSGMPATTTDLSSGKYISSSSDPSDVSPPSSSSSDPSYASPLSSSPSDVSPPSLPSSDHPGHLPRLCHPPTLGLRRPPTLLRISPVFLTLRPSSASSSSLPSSDPPRHLLRISPVFLTLLRISLVFAAFPTPDASPLASLSHRISPAFLTPTHLPRL
ncbi:hypothetical protein FA13DRAFT_1800334 [Coprinellus micaceus]|uniref:Uncharacterized protein n=1 Tax=Coprinellus micaceus TaxID=71717 RepID=A0A4Y7SH65_COPMI|nr:hypothetical protein FA13DRAFT_1800334 [Coprinellus micaceus]